MSASHLVRTFARKDESVKVEQCLLIDSSSIMNNCRIANNWRLAQEAIELQQIFLLSFSSSCSVPEKLEAHKGQMITTSSSQMPSNPELIL